MTDIKRILVLNRLSQYTHDALRYGMVLAKRFEAELCILRVISNPVDMEAVNAPGLFLKGEKYRDYRDLQEQYQEDLDRAICGETKGEARVRGVVTDKDPIPEITRMVREERFDLLVILAHEEGRLEHMLFGENDGLIRNLPCSILLVKHEPRQVG
ncbi:universal stress protein [Geomonas ferrireducens]|uniref:universal stress protein n=1 Tax=Geomonas ferrireducens TaxID=2570227 RepID=UPI0010A90D78|nr:universal stress protein [Geomonas ferrireducens]